MTGHVQAASRVIQPPGDAVEDWQILTKLGVVFGANVAYTSTQAIREAIAAGTRRRPGIRGARLDGVLAADVRRRSGCRRRIRPSGGSGTSCSRICRR